MTAHNHLFGQISTLIARLETALLTAQSSETGQSSDTAPLEQENRRLRAQRDELLTQLRQASEVIGDMLGEDEAQKQSLQITEADKNTADFPSKQGVQMNEGVREESWK